MRRLPGFRRTHKLPQRRRAKLRMRNSKFARAKADSPFAQSSVSASHYVKQRMKRLKANSSVRSALTGRLLRIARIGRRSADLAAAGKLDHVPGFARVGELHRLPGLLRFGRVSFFRAILFS